MGDSQNSEVCMRDISLNFSLGVNLTPSNCQSDTLKLVWVNPKKKQSRKKYWANLRLVWNQQERRTA